MRWLDRLPHQPPMRLLEDVVDVIAGESAVGRRTAAAGDFYFQGHFPGHARRAGDHPRSRCWRRPAALPPRARLQRRPILGLRVAAIGPFKFPAAAGPGARLEARARVAGKLGRMFKIEGEVSADGRVVAVGSLTLAG